MITRAQAREALFILKALQLLKERANTLTDKVCDIDGEKGTDDMQTTFWQNFQYIFDSIDSEDIEELEDFIKETLD